MINSEKAKHFFKTVRMINVISYQDPKYSRAKVLYHFPFIMLLLITLDSLDLVGKTRDLVYFITIPLSLGLFYFMIRFFIKAEYQKFAEEIKKNKMRLNEYRNLFFFYLVVIDGLFLAFVLWLK